MFLPPLLAIAVLAGDNAGMQTIDFTLAGRRHRLTTFDDPTSISTARDIIGGVSYRFPDAGFRAKCIVDLGAHVGEFTIMAAAFWPEATIHAFEPAPQAIPLLRENCRPYSNIVIHEQGFRLASGRGPFYQNSVSSVASASVVERRVPGVEYTTVEAEYVDAQSIMDLKPDVLKIDIEGPEVEFVKAAMPALEQVTMIYVEFHSEDRRVDLDRYLIRTHALYTAHILEPMRGDLLYARRKQPLFPKT